MLKKCPLCEGEIKLVEKKVLISVPNPGELLIDTTCGECKNCGEKYFDEEQADVFAKKIDKEVKEAEGKKPLRIGSGTLII